MTALVVERAGDGPPVLMVHGLGGTSNTWQPLMAALAGYRVIRPDLAGAGRSPWPVEPLSIEGHAADLAALIQGPVHLVGHSMGTLVCQHLAASRPDLVASLTLFGALTEPGEAAREALIGRAALARAEGMAGIAERIAATTLAPQSLEQTPAAAAFVRESILRQPPEGYARNAEALARARAVRAPIAAPVLLVTGDADPVAPTHMARELADRLARATLTVLDRCGHWATLEQPQACARLIAGFLATTRH